MNEPDPGGAEPRPAAGRQRARVVWRALRLRWWHGLTRYIVEHDIEGGWIIIVFAAAIGVAAGYAIIGFYALVSGVERLASAAGGLLPGAAGGAWLPFLVVPLGLLLSRRLIAPFGPGSGEMVPALIRAVAKRGGELPFAPMAARLAAAGITLGSGGSLGAEGPVAAAGATIGSGLGRAFGFRPGRLKVLLACGTAAGISAAFNAPIAGVLFALEIVLGTFAVAALSPVVVASVMGAVVSRSYLGSHPAFDVPSEFVLVAFRELGLYLLLGLSCGALAALFVRVFFATQDALRRVAGDGLAATALAGLLLAAAGVVHPELLGAGREGIGLVLFGQMAGFAALALGLLKIVTAGLTMAGRGAGGLFTPSLFVGAAFGSFFGLSAQALFPRVVAAPEAYALVGMAGVVAGSTFAPLTAIVMVFEMTDDYGLILALMLVCVLSYLVARRLSGESIYSAALRRSGERIQHGADRSILERIHVAECYDRRPQTIPEGASLGAVLALVRGSRQTEFPVLTGTGELAGVITYQELTRSMGESGLEGLVLAADLATEGVETVFPEDTLLDAMRRMSVRGLDYIPVVEGGDSGRLLGILGRADILEAYERHLVLGT